MTRDATVEQSVRNSETMAQLYSPSWVDRFIDWVERLPGPYWLFYLALGLVAGFAQTLVQWREGSYPIGTLHPFHIWFAGQIAYLLALMHYLDKSADTALTTFRPVLKVSEAEYAELRYRLTTLPARPTLLANLAGVAVAILSLMLFPSFFQLFKFATSPVSIIFNIVLDCLIQWIAASVVYHTVHQLRLVSRIYATHAIVNLFRLGPLYAFSGLTARTAVGLIIYPYAWIATAPRLLSQHVGIGFGIFYVLVSIATFAWPLLGIHRRLVEEKERLLDEGSQRLEATIAELHRRVDAGNLENMTELYRTMSSLDIERDILAKIPTWPWQPGTLRGLASALLLPVAVWLIQLLLERLIGL